MIKSDNGMVTIKGDGATLLAELCCVITSLKDSGIPENVIMGCVSVGLAYTKKTEDKTEDEELAINFVKKLLQRVKEKGDAKNDNS